MGILDANCGTDRVANALPVASASLGQDLEGLGDGREVQLLPRPERLDGVGARRAPRRP
jgi:hypothetical protein